MQHSQITYHAPNNETKDDIKKVIIWLHGLGVNGNTFISIVPHLNLPFAVKFIFPHAPDMPVTVNGGFVMPAWYDILAMSETVRKVDTAGVQHSANRILDIIKAETERGVALGDIVVAGFSQGGAVAYHTAMSVKGLGGLLALSTYLATEELIKDNIQADRGLPIFIGHGDNDHSVSPTFARLAVDSLQTWGFNPKLHLYPTAHCISFSQIDDIAHWLIKVLT